MVFKSTFHGLLSLVGGKLFLGAKIAVLTGHVADMYGRSKALDANQICIVAVWTESAARGQAFIDAIGQALKEYFVFGLGDIDGEPTVAPQLVHQYFLRTALRTPVTAINNLKHAFVRSSVPSKVDELITGVR
jgi:hypothetical protein